MILASALGLPVSSTHIAVGAIFGVGFFREWDAERRLRLARRGLWYVTAVTLVLLALVVLLLGTACKPEEFPGARDRLRGSATSGTTAADSEATSESTGGGAEAGGELGGDERARVLVAADEVVLVAVVIGAAVVSAARGVGGGAHEPGRKWMSWADTEVAAPMST